MKTSIELPISHDPAKRAERRVFKYPLSVMDRVTAEMPIGAEILCVQEQRDVPCIWALVNPNNETETRHFRITGTGHPLVDPVGRYVGTFQIFGGSLVFHVFEVTA